MSAARSYAAWVERNRVAIIGASLALAALAASIALRLSVQADLSYLLPPSLQSVKDLRVIEARSRVIGTTMITVVSASPEERRTAASEVRRRVEAIGKQLVENVTFDRRVEKQYAWDHRWLFADLTDLEAARDALSEQIARAKVEANPLYVALDEPPAHASDQKLRDKLRDAERDRDAPSELVNSDGRVQLMIVHTAFSTGDIDRDRELVDAIERIGSDVRARFPSVEIGIAGDAVVSLAEHDGILSGMLRATIVTLVLVLVVLVWFFRSALAIGALSWSLVVGTLATFAFARVALGYLNVATAFLSSIVIGNGINVGILVTSRYLEEVRAGNPHALASTLEKTLAPTLAAALTAAVAYGSLVITVFRGFRDFGIIGGVGILLCWASAYVVLPAALSLSRAAGMRATDEPSVGRWVARLASRRASNVVVAISVITMAAGAIAVRFLLADPFEDDLRNLRSQSDALERAQHAMGIIDQQFGVGMDAGFAIIVPREADTRHVAEAMRAHDRDKPDADRLFGRVATLDDLLPADQDKKLAVLSDIRALLSGKDVEALSDADRAEALRLRPPDDLRPLGYADIPDAVAQPFIEADGSRGKLILATLGPGYDDWTAHDNVRFAKNVRALQLPADVHFGGASFVFADVIDAVMTDGPRATLAAACGAILIVLLVVGLNRYAAVTLACGASGVLLMIGGGALLGFRINFLDFVALPITIGIGVEYALNIVARLRDDPEALAATGGAVTLCSYTTVVGYGALRLSENLGIRSFGLAAMLGELTCLTIALLLAPALVRLLQRRRA
jgi:predicted RND superfamily exporter protein